ncbi:Type 1 glutamine amidotransferase-like domain-containing protein [Pirellula sp. SH-Sr6A]|uniref:Type 1 glutamine amidotransferase-like domain-containing protein n=1 Tax=Pirellula sp. SH-Sr6A TaxID=1632865 RepID=UPI00143A0C8A|nr:Type 1 glutamine amidotransferase-like domain-containing protein [Pirellula sp. SH-Sr6A]
MNAQSQTFDERFEDWPVDLKIKGVIVAIHSETIPDHVLESSLPDSISKSILVLTNRDQDEVSSEFQNTQSRPTAPKVESISLIESQQESTYFQKWDTLVWSESRTPDEIPPPLMKRFEQLARAHIDRGKNLVIAGPHAKALSKFYIRSLEEGHPRIAAGMNLFPDVVLETNCPKSREGNPHVLSVLASQPRCVGIALERNSAVVLRGRKLRVLGSGEATLMVQANRFHPIRLHTITSESSGANSPNRYLADLTEWRRDAMDRTLPLFPPTSPGLPVVEKGTLLIVGGGGLPTGLMDQFCELAGGPENANLVYIPCEEREDVAEEQSIIENWKKRGFKNATLIHTKDRNKANEDEAFLAPLKKATGIWFGGGRQWNLADSYYGTTAQRLMKEVLHRGGVIGGSSAGASIQARYLARATPIENFNIMAPGYERGGLGFLDGVAIDQHFTQRSRQRDMTHLVNRYPQLLGIGIDETTAITVTGSKATVSGKGKVYFYDRRQPVYPDRPDYIALASGESYDLAARKTINSEMPKTKNE